MFQVCLGLWFLVSGFNVRTQQAKHVQLHPHKTIQITEQQFRTAHGESRE